MLYKNNVCKSKSTHVMMVLSILRLTITSRTS